MAEQPTQELRDALYTRAGGYCECVECAQHSGKCTNPLRNDVWEVYRIRAGGPYSPDNTRALCQACRRSATGYGVG